MEKMDFMVSEYAILLYSISQGYLSYFMSNCDCSNIDKNHLRAYEKLTRNGEDVTQVFVREKSMNIIERFLISSLSGNKKEALENMEAEAFDNLHIEVKNITIDYGKQKVCILEDYYRYGNLKIDKFTFDIMLNFALKISEGRNPNFDYASATFSMLVQYYSLFQRVQQWMPSEAFFNNEIKKYLGPSKVEKNGKFTGEGRIYVEGFSSPLNSVILRYNCSGIGYSLFDIDKIWGFRTDFKTFTPFDNCALYLNPPHIMNSLVLAANKAIETCETTKNSRVVFLSPCWDKDSEHIKILSNSRFLVKKNNENIIINYFPAKKAFNGQKSFGNPIEIITQQGEQINHLKYILFVLESK